MQDTWETGDPYDFFMGRWSRIVAHEFLNWVSPEPGLKWIDVGCGLGALSHSIVQKLKPEYLFAIDQSEGFIKTAQSRLGRQAICKVGNTLNLPVDDNRVDMAVSGLVLNFITEPINALAEMNRVTQSGGTVAAYIWDYAGKMEFLQHIWSAASELKQEATELNETKRFSDWDHKLLRKLFADAGLIIIKTTLLVVDTLFSSFEDDWKPFLGGQGPAPSYLMSLGEADRQRLKDLLYKSLPIQTNGSIPLSARALAIKGTVKK